MEEVVSRQPENATAVSLLGLVDAGMGRRQQAIAEGRRACEMLPIERDSLDGALIAMNMAQILAMVGEKTAAIDQLVALRQVPNTSTYGNLKLHPRWDGLRGDRRFDTLIEALAPTVRQEL